MVEMHIGILPETGPGGFPPSGVIWVVKRENETLQLWTDWKNNNSLFVDGDLETELPLALDEVWIEALQDGASSITFEVRVEETGAVLASDKLVFSTFESVVVILSGENGLPLGNAENHGTTPLAFTLSEQGYNVRLHDEEEVFSDGDGLAHAKIIQAIDKRGIEEVAIIGYSHGGGAVHDLANRLSNIESPTEPFTLTLTGYIDAIEQGFGKDFGQDPEVRLPPGTNMHLNVWQPQATALLFVHGGPVPGATVDINVNEAPPAGWGLNHTHGTIDDDAAVRNVFIEGILNNVSR